MRILKIVALGAALGNCASSAAVITPTYVSPITYQSRASSLGRKHRRYPQRGGALPAARSKRSMASG
jgi:hypothetical protein